MVRWTGNDAPGGVYGPGSEPFEKRAGGFAGSIPRPRTDVEIHDLEVIYGSETYPLRVRVHPQTDRVQLTVAIDRPKSCADVHLRRLEKPTLTQTSSVKAAFTLGYMIDGRAGENSCDEWPLRAAKARFDRYYNAMERSNVLVIPDGVKAALRSAATKQADRDRMERLIASGDQAERHKLASSLQVSVLANLEAGDVSAAYASSALLSETAKAPGFADAVASQIELDVLDRQTRDLGERAGIPDRPADPRPEQQ